MGGYGGRLQNVNFICHKCLDLLISRPKIYNNECRKIFKRSELDTLFRFTCCSDLYAHVCPTMVLVGTPVHFYLLCAGNGFDVKRLVSSLDNKKG